MEQIDPILILEPVIVIGFSLGTLLYWRRKGRITKYVLGFSLLSYGGAIAAKILFQYLTALALLSLSQGSLWFLGVYFGFQTMAFEVGGAFLVARFAVSRRKMNRRDGVGYGSCLAFWENAVVIAAFALINLLSYFVTIMNGGAAADSLFALLSKSQPQLFLPTSGALQVIGWGLLERISSLMAHLSWGYLCLRSALTRRYVYLWFALPMGLIDFLVPFAGTMPLPLFEIIVFMMAAFCILATVWVTRR